MRISLCYFQGKLRNIATRERGSTTLSRSRSSPPRICALGDHTRTHKPVQLRSCFVSFDLRQMVHDWCVMHDHGSIFFLCAVFRRDLFLP